MTETFFTPGYLSQSSSHLSILAEILSRGELHKLIREKGGAYGSGVKFNELAGAFSFFSYRDPHSWNTLDNFKTAIQEAANGNFSESDVEAAKLSLFSKVDTPQTNQNHGLRWFYYGLTDETYQQKRGEILGASKANMVDLAKNLLLKDLEAGKSSKIIFGTSATDLEKFEKEGWKVEKFSEGLKLRKKLYEGAEDEVVETM